MSIENDIIKIRQILAELQKKGNFYVTYNEADLTAKPSNPTGDGDTGDDAIAGWSTIATEASQWMSTKRSGNINTGTWSDPIAIRGAVGTYLEYIFKRGATAPTKPDQADGVGEASPNDWYDAPPAADGNPLWMCTAWKMASGAFATGVTEWDAPVQVEGASVSVQYSINGSTSWHSTFAAGDIYMRQSTDAGATWSSAMRIVGETGATGSPGSDGSDFGPLSDDIPEMTGIRFAIASGNLAWTGGTIEYGGSTYTLTADPTGLNNDYVYFDATDSTPGGAAVFRGTDTLSIAIDITGSGHWCMCKRESGNAYPAAPFKVIQAEAMLVASLAAISANLGSITSGDITLSLGGDTRLRIDSSGIYTSNNAGGAWTEVIKNDSGTVKMFADILEAGEIITAKVADNAISNRSSASTQAESVAISGTDPGTEMESVAITTEGDDVELNFSCKVRNSSVSTGEYRVLVLRDSTTIMDTGTTHLIKIPGSSSRTEAFTFVDSPGAGSYTYYVYIDRVTGPLYGSFRTLSAKEIKK